MKTETLEDRGHPKAWMDGILVHRKTITDVTYTSSPRLGDTEYLAQQNYSHSIANSRVLRQINIFVP